MSKRLVAFFSASGNTKKIAQTLAEAAGADLYEITPRVAYTSADLNWMDKKSRSSVEMKDKKIRPDAFTEEFSRQKFAGILFSLMLSAVVQQDFDPTAVLEIIRRTIYEV